MSEIITVINMKGGVGKTTLSVNVAYCLARYHNKKVLIVDIDPQFNATQYLVGQDVIIEHFNTKKTVYDILMPVKEEKIVLSERRKTAKGKAANLTDFLIPIKRYRSGGFLDLIPSSLNLIYSDTFKRGSENLMKRFLEANCGHYDIIIIDCPPTLSILTLSAFIASSHYAIPIKPDYLSSLGLPLLQRGLGEIEESHGLDLNLLGIIFTMVNSTILSTEVMENIKDQDWECFSGFSSHSTKVAKSVNNMDLFYNQTAYRRYADEFKTITTELLSKISLT